MKRSFNYNKGSLAMLSYTFSILILIFTRNNQSNLWLLSLPFGIIGSYYLINAFSVKSEEEDKDGK